MSVTLAALRVVTPDGVLSPGWVRCEGEVIVAVGGGHPGLSGAGGGASGVLAPGDAGEVRELGDVTLVPGFVDAHVHGGGGASYPEVTPGDAAPALVARDAHLARGTTSTMASLVAAEPAALLEQVTALAPLVAAGELRGIHLEGPWLNPLRKGAHAESALRAPDVREIDEVLAAGAGAIGMVTIAPELPGALAAIERLVSSGVVVAVGHTDADYEQARRAIDAGATVATHLFNAMPPLLHRAPGPVLALLRDPRVALELVADGVHLDPALVSWVEETAGTDRVMLVTDAMGAAACPDGAYRLGALDVDVMGGVARVAGTETIAGSTATMDSLFRGRATIAASKNSGEAGSASASVALDAAERAHPHFDDASLLAAVQLTATNPARAMGWNDVGSIAVGKKADFVVLDPSLEVKEVIRVGRE